MVFRGRKILITHNEDRNFNLIYRKVLKDLVDYGELVESTIDQYSIGSNFGTKERKTKEILGYRFVLKNPRSRLMYSIAREFHLHYAIGNFIWNVSSSNKLESIKYYNGKGQNFSDDGKTVNGNAYGKRLNKSYESIGQIEKIITRLKADKNSRRTFIPIFNIRDNFDITRDVPCVIGIQYFIRNDKLHSVNYMRSNSAALVMPYNVFFFTMLQELIANELEVELGEYIHFCGSLHYYLDEHDLVKKILNEKINSNNNRVMPSMPKDCKLNSLNSIIRYADDLRTLNDIDENEWIKKAKNLGEYWSQIGFILLAHSLQKNNKDGSYIADYLDDVYKPFLEVPNF